MRRLFFKYLHTLKPYAPILTIVFFGDLAVASFNLVTPLFSRLLFDYAYPLKDLFILNLVLAASVGLYFVQFFINVLCDYMATYVDQSAGGGLTHRLFLKCQHLPMKFHSDRGTGDLVNLFTRDVGVVVTKSIETLPQILLHAYSLVSILIVAFFMNYKITLLALLSIPLYVLETKYFARKEEILEEQDIRLDGEFYDILHERFRGIRTIKAFGQELSETEKVARKRCEMNTVAIKRGLVTVISVFTNSVTIRMWSVFLGWYMGYLVIQNELTVGEVVALLAYVALMSDPIKSLSKVYGDLKVAMVSYRRIDDVLSAREENETGKEDLSVTQAQVSFRDIGFAYDANSEMVLKGLSFDLPPRTAVAIVGESGSGKSTIVSLLMRFYQPQLGAICIDSQNIFEVRPQALRQKMGLVQQEYNLFQGTLRENIMYGNSNKSEAQMIEACKQAQIYDFINDLPDSFEHQIGVGGDGLSGGQKQRVAIARVLLRDPDIIIFDEATSALDPESEYKITEVINSLIGKKTLFIIAHRLSTIKKVDRILMLEEGSIIEWGSFSDLIDKKGAFFKYYARQFGGLEAFKKILEIEYERVQRYGSQFNLVVAEVWPYGLHGELAADFVDEAGFFIKRHLRKGDSSAVFFKNFILILFPEISDEQMLEFISRMDRLLQENIIVVNGQEIRMNLKYSVTHVKGTPFQIVDDLIALTVENLKHIKSEGPNYYIQLIDKVR